MKDSSHIHASQWCTTYWLEACGVIGWLLKDVGWVLLLWPVGWSAAALALATESARLWVSWTEESIGVRAHTFAALLWLLGNAFWMSGELLFDEESQPGRQFPWSDGPMASSHQGLYDAAVTIFRCCSGLGLAILSWFYLTSLRESLWPMEDLQESTQDDREEADLIFGFITPEVYEWAFIGPWIVKDLFWASELLIPALISGSLVVFLLVDNFRRTRHPLIGAELLWVSANYVWIWAELHWNDQHRWARILAASLLGIGIVVVIIGSFSLATNDKMRTYRAHGRSSECRPLQQGLIVVK